MGPVVRVPAEVAASLETGDLVEQVITVADAVDVVDIQLGPDDGTLLMLVEAAPQGYDELVEAILGSADVRGTAGRPFALVVRDADEQRHTYPNDPVTAERVRALLEQAAYGDPGERRPVVAAAS
jgi:hypothetical protein